MSIEEIIKIANRIYRLSPLNYRQYGILVNDLVSKKFKIIFIQNRKDVLENNLVNLKNEAKEIINNED